jgi:hypothetical protein
MVKEVNQGKQRVIIGVLRVGIAMVGLNHVDPIH